MAQEDGRAMAAKIARCMRDAAYAAWWNWPRRRAPFRRSRPTATWRIEQLASRLDEPLKAAIREHGIRNSHLLSIAPTGTVSLALADNASNGIEPAFW